MELRYNPLYGDANLQGYYRLGDATEDGGGTSLTAGGSVSYVDGKYGDCANFGTGSNKLFVGSVFSTTVNSAKSISLWVNPNSQPTDTTERGMFDISYATGDAYYFVGYENNGGTKRLEMARDRFNVARTSHYSNQTLSTGTWYHIVFVHHGNGTASLYLDGSVILSAKSMGTASGNDGANTRLTLNETSDGNRYGQFKIDDVGIFNRVLTATEIADLYAAGADGAFILGTL